MFLRPTCDPSVKPSITVLLPVFNGFEAVRQCLDSLFKDDLDSAISELIIIDDASTDPRMKELLEIGRAHV